MKTCQKECSSDALNWNFSIFYIVFNCKLITKIWKLSFTYFHRIHGILNTFFFLSLRDMLKHVVAISFIYASAFCSFLIFQSSIFASFIPSVFTQYPILTTRYLFSRCYLVYKDCYQFLVNILVINYRLLKS